MDTTIKAVVIVLAVLWTLFNVHSCTSCYSAGGTPVRGVVGFACVK